MVSDPLQVSIFNLCTLEITSLDKQHKRAVKKKNLEELLSDEHAVWDGI